ncbi:MAG TPA: threonine/serine exporter family protein [Gemmatimonadaceae bacterium]|nr:threonine/serine exporter family protein [Gemmatimonadaceae bacterium]
MVHSTDSFDARAHFLTELARRLHIAGVSASRLEGAVVSTSRALGITCEIWSAPTGVLLSLGDAGDPRLPQRTHVLRLEPGNVDLQALVTLNEIADAVIAGTLAPRDALLRLQTVDRPRTGGPARVVFAFGLAAAAVAGLFRTGWADVALAGVLGLMIGLIAVRAQKEPNLGAAMEALAAFVATVLASAFAHFVAPVSAQTVVIAAVIVLMPGLTLTTAMAELASQQLVTGTTRFAGAIVVLLKLTFGSVAGTQLVNALGWTPMLNAPAPLPPAVEFVAAIAASYSFAVLFGAARRDYLLVMASALLGYVLTRVATHWHSLGDGTAFAGAVFFSSFVMAALSNAYARITARPGALVRLPGIMLMVPGSIGFRGLASVMQHDYVVGLDTAVAVMSALLALMAGLLFGSLIVPPRRFL